jgi:flagellar assembly factor FliW
VLYELRSVEKPELSFLVGVPRAFFPEYTVELDDQSCDDLGLHEPADALVLVILSAGADPAATTANLLAPVVINAHYPDGGAGDPVRFRVAGARPDRLSLS